MRTLIICLITLLSFNLSHSQTDNPIVDKIKNVKELYDMNIISKKEYDSITNILVKDLVNQKSSSNLLLENKTESEQINTQASETEYIMEASGWYGVWKTDENGLRYKITTVKNPGDELKNQNINNLPYNQMNSQESLVFDDDTAYDFVAENSWAIEFGVSSAEATIDGSSESVESTGWSLGVVNRWYSSESLAWEAGISYGESKVKDYDETGTGIGLGINALFYVDPTMGGFHFTIGLGVSSSLDEKIEGVKQELATFGVGIGVDVSDEFTISAGWSTHITEPYEGYLSDLNDDINTSGFGIAVKVRL